jgi:hypothetical protein
MQLIAVGLIGAFMAILLALSTALLCSLPVMWLWNAMMPDVFGMKQLTWVQALWLSLLCALLFRTTTHSSTGER